MARRAARARARAERLGRPRAGREGRRPRDRRLLRLGRGRPAGDARGLLPRRGGGARWRGPRPIATSRPSTPASPTRSTCRTGTRRSRSTSRACARRTRRTGPIIAPRPRRSCHSRTGRHSGAIAWALPRRSACGRRPAARSMRRGPRSRGRCCPASIRRRPGWCSRPVRDAGARGRAGRGRLRRILPGLQRVPDRGGAAAGRALLPAGRRAALARDRPAARGRLAGGARPAPADAGGARPVHAGRLAGDAGRRRVRLAGPARPAHRLGGRGRASPSCGWPSTPEALVAGAIAAVVAGLLSVRLALRAPAPHQPAPAPGRQRRRDGSTGATCDARSGSRRRERSWRRGSRSPRCAAASGPRAVSSAPASACWRRPSHSSGIGSPARPRPLRSPPSTALGMRNATWRPGRSLLVAALLAFGTFVVVAVGAFRKDTAQATAERHTGHGGYALVGESPLPLLLDPATRRRPRRARSLGRRGRRWRTSASRASGCCPATRRAASTSTGRSARACWARPSRS